ncbi:MAG: RelA/SpoT family protein [Fibrobacterota bacterium]
MTYGITPELSALFSQDSYRTYLDSSLERLHIGPSHLHESGAAEVALIAAEEMGLRDTVIQGAVLFMLCRHDFLNLEKHVRSRFSPETAEIVHGALKIIRLETGKMDYQLDSFIKLILSIADDPRSVLLVLAQQLRLMRSIDTVRDRALILKWVGSVFAPIAHRLGLYRVKTELEERWLKEYDYATYRSIANKLEAKKDEREAFIASFIAPVRRMMDQAGIECEIKGRPKSIFSIWKKMQKQRVDVDGIYDKFAIRLIIKNVPPEREKEYCWRAYSLITEQYRPFPKRLRDWISHPKSSGYESLHTTVATEKGEWVEVQIRTERMDYIAEKGQAAHWLYKEQGSGGGTDYLAGLRRALENPGELEHHTGSLKKALYSRELYVFTPRDELKKLHAGATVLDFAFAVHTTLGFRCVGGRINGKHASIKEKLYTGDVVEILTSRSQQPGREWLDIVTSSSAKVRIRRFLREKQSSHAGEGKDIVRRRIHDAGREMTDALLKRLVDSCGCSGVIDLYDRVGAGKVDVACFERVLTEERGHRKQPAPARRSRRHPRGEAANCLVIDENIDNIKFTLPRCCSPVQGDAIFGFITVNKGITIHRTDCPNAADLMENHPERIIDVQWNRQEQARFTRSLRVVSAVSGADILSKVNHEVNAAAGVTLIRLNLNNALDTEINITLEVSRSEQYESLVQRLDGLSGVRAVYTV